MRIISTRQQFIADHSSTNYLFYAAKPISQASRAVVSKLSSHVDVGNRTAQITYHGDFADMGDERRKKFLQHYDVEVRESYDWWTLSVMLEPKKLPEIHFEDYEVEDEASLTFEKQGPRIRLCFDSWNQDYSASYDELGEDPMEGLAELGLQLRAELYAGKTEALDVMHDYCAERRILKGRKSPVAKQLAAILEVVG
ncbi:MAG TPA: hypothetical protein VKL40_09500 [Candidatus Angelobacter sp.]|nr:hypothetical protein [Candidatus Angelobacter sp.]